MSAPNSLTAAIKLDPDVLSYDFYGQIPIKKTTAAPIQKVVNKGSVIKIDCDKHWNGTRGPWNLGLADVFKLTNVHVGSTSGTAYSDANIDRRDWFYIETGQTDDTYKHARLVIKPNYAGSLGTGSTLLVKVNHFTANITSSKTGFFSVDSYPIDDANTSNTQAIATAEIPIYVDTHSITYDLRNHLDFRFVMANTANVTTALADATINPANNFTTYYTGAAASVGIEPNSNFEYNVEYYLPRRDTLVLNRDGSVAAKLGQPSLRPQLPGLNKSGIQLAEIAVPPYPSLTFAESE